MKGIKTFFIILLLSIICTIFTRAECIYLSSKINDYYSADTSKYSATLVYDVSGYNNNATINGVHTAYTGKIDKGLFCDGNDYLSITQIATGTGDFSFGAWINFNSTLDYPHIMHIGSNSASAQLQMYVGPTNYQVICGLHSVGATNAKKTLSPNKWYFAVCVFSGGNTAKLYINDTLIGSDTNSYNVGAGTERICGDNSGGVFIGNVDEAFFENSALNSTEISDLYNSYSGCNPYTVTAGDTTPPTITFSSQRPTNLSTTNALSTGLKINYTITDLTGVNLTSVKMNFTVNNSNVWINGYKYPMTYNNKPYNNNVGSMFNWNFDDNLIYNSIGLVNESLIESTVHNILILGNANNWLKITFRNVSKYKSYSFYEGMTQNASSTLCSLQLYYCNSSYTSGNPISSKNCALFYEGINTNVYNHSHSAYSKHKVYPMAISNGMVNGVGVTQTSNILYRGNNICNQNIYYVNLTHRVNDVQTTGNNGNVWNNYVGTIDGHLHQISTNKSESINYFIRACDTLGNCINSAKRSDIIELTNLNPSSPFIYNPIGTTYISNTPININYSACASPQLTPINRYKIDYAPYLSTTYTNIVSNNYPNLNYLWAINTISSGFYNIKVTCYDTTNKSSYSISETFSIVSFTDLLLTGINNSNSNIADYADSINTNVSNIWGEIKMMGLIVLFLTFLLIATSNETYKFMYIFSSLLFFVIGSNLRTTYPSYNTFFTLMTYAICILLMFLGIFLTYTNMLSSRKKESKKYGDFRDSYPKY